MSIIQLPPLPRKNNNDKVSSAFFGIPKTQSTGENANYKTVSNLVIKDCFISVHTTVPFHNIILM